MIRILNVEPFGYCDEARRILSTLGELHERALDRTGLLSVVGDFDVLIVRLGFQVDREILDAGRHLKALVTATTGLDHIDLDYARTKGIAVLSLRGEQPFLRSVTATAEHTLALLLTLVRKIPQAFTSVRDGEWDRDRFRGMELSGKRLGLLGLGRLGEKVARYGLAFEMRVLAYDPYLTVWPPGVTRCQSLEALLRQSDILSLHVPLDAKTEGMIGQDEFALLPTGAILVNTARGALIRSEPLLEALKSGTLAGAALDVIDEELDRQERPHHPLIQYARTHDNLLITPHIGGATWDSMKKTEIFMARKLKAFLENHSSGAPL